MAFRLVFLFSLILLLFESSAQCTIESKLYLPTPEKSIYNSYATAMDIDGNTMVVGAMYVDSLETDAGLVYVYELDASGKWKKVAHLAPSDPVRFLRFGIKVAISGNIIVVQGTTFVGINNEALFYVYEKDPDTGWVSGTEHSKLTNSGGLLGFELFNEELVTISLENNKALLKVFTATSTAFSLQQNIELPQEGDGHVSYDYELALNEEMVVVGISQFNHEDGSHGAVFLYEKNNGSYEASPKALLRPSAPDVGLYQGLFGESIYLLDETLYILGYMYNSSFNNRYLTTVYIYEKPSGGGVNMTETNRIAYEAFTTYEPTLFAKDSHIFVGGNQATSWSMDPELFIQGFKKTGSDWAQGVESFRIANPEPDTYFGKFMDGTGDHLVFAAPVHGSFDNEGPELVIDYYAASRDWKNIVQPNQVIEESTFDASTSRFGDAMAVMENYLAIGAPYSSVRGHLDGKVYLYKTDLPQGSTPEIILSPEQESYAIFGNAIAMGDDMLFVAALGKDSLQSGRTRAFYNIGKVYMYQRTEEGWKYRQQIVAPQARPEQGFGQALAYHNNYLAVSEFYEGSSESDGRVHLYKKGEDDQFRFLATLQPSYDIRGDFFGRQIVMDDSLIVVGTGNPEFTTGQSMRVFVYVKNGEWQSGTEDAQLYPAVPKYSDRFGYSIAMYDEVIVVGAPRYPGYWVGGPVPVENAQGSAYIFLRPEAGWKGIVHESAQLFPSDPVNFNYFGYSVGVEYDDIFVGAPHTIDYHNYADKTSNPDGSILPGRIYHYTRPSNGWKTTHQEKRQLQSFEPDWLDGYGYKLLVTDRYLYASSLFDDTEMGFESGSVQTLMQLPIIRPMDPLCMESGAVQVKGFPRRGEWSGVGMNASTGQFDPMVAGVGTHAISYTYSGCTTESSLEVVSFDLTIYDRSAEELMKCYDTTIPLLLRSNKPAENYTWYYKESADGIFSPLLSGKDEIIATVPGHYQVSIAHDVCPPVLTNFLVSDEPIIEFTEETTPVICSDEVYQFTISPTGGVWSGLGVDSDGLLHPQEYSDGNFEVLYTYTSSLGCVYNDTREFTVDKLLTPRIEKEGDKVCSETPVFLHARDVDQQSTVEWLSSTTGLSAGSDRTLNVLEAGDYAVRAFKHGCMKESNPQTVEALVDSLFVPNVITVNGDSRNDVFKIVGTDLNSFKAEVFNRYGQLVFTTEDPEFIWRAEDVATGVYYWRIQYANCASISKEQVGWLHVIK